MPSSTLTQHDISILEKIKDPESGPSAPLLIDPSLPRDPHITDEAIYLKVSSLERSIISSIQAIELQIAGLKPQGHEPPLIQYLSCVSRLDKLIEENPDYASARNNRAQALRRIYGDGLLIKNSISSLEQGHLDVSSDESTLATACHTILSDLNTAISLLTPPAPFSPLSPQAAKTLSQAYTQRGAIYLHTSKALAGSKSEPRIDDRRELFWSKSDFEENASRDFMMGGRYGNEVAKALAVASNPTAKLCGAIVKEAMRKEFGFAEGG